MLKSQPEKPVFTGGMESALLQPWHVEFLREVKTKRIYFSYDMPSDYEPLVQAGRFLREGGVTKASNTARCYVLVGYPGDTMTAAESRLYAVWDAGFMPYCMLFRDESGTVDDEWKKFQRAWVRPAIVMSRLKTYDGMKGGEHCV